VKEVKEVKGVKGWKGVKGRTVIASLRSNPDVVVCTWIASCLAM